VNDLPLEEVEDIVSISCGIAPKLSKMLVNIMRELQQHRQQSNLFQGKHGAVTPRDLIKCGKRQPQSGGDVAKHTYKMLAEKLRTAEERVVVKEIIDVACNVQLDIDELYFESDELDTLQEALQKKSLIVEGVPSLGVTTQMRRMWRLVSDALDHIEPALLVGETSTGKTTLCQLYAATRQQRYTQAHFIHTVLRTIVLIRVLL
jgi:midasin